MKEITFNDYQELTIAREKGKEFLEKVVADYNELEATTGFLYWIEGSIREDAYFKLCTLNDYEGIDINDLKVIDADESEIAEWNANLLEEAANYLKKGEPKDTGCGPIW